MAIKALVAAGADVTKADVSVVRQIVCTALIHGKSQMFMRVVQFLLMFQAVESYLVAQMFCMQMLLSSCLDSDTFLVLPALDVAHVGPCYLTATTGGACSEGGSAHLT